LLLLLLKQYLWFWCTFLCKK